MNLFCKILYFSLSISLVYSASVKIRKTYQNYKLFDVQGGKNELREMIEYMKDVDDSLVYKEIASSTQVLVSPELEAIFNNAVNKLQLKAVVVTDDYSRIIQSETKKPLKEGFSWDAYYDVDDIYNYLRKVSKEYPSWAELVEGGRTYEGRKILGVRINTPNPLAANESKPAVFIESGIHAREWIAPATTTYLINQLMTSNDPNITALRDNFEWHIFPTVNPDGYHYSFNIDRMWRKTRSRSSLFCYGADPNRNWDYNWGVHSASSRPCDYQLYAGSKPFSEVETRTLAQYISSIENLQAYIAYHSYAQILLLPYSDSTEHVDNYDDLVRIGNSSFSYGYEVNHVRYDKIGTAGEILYKASGGSMDWVRHTLGVPLVYTYELRGSSFHWPPSRIVEQGEEVVQMMVGLMAEAFNLGYF